MATCALMKKTAAIRQARQSVPPPLSFHPPGFVVRIPAEVGQVDGGWIEVAAKDYLDAQHIRSYWIARIALGLMGLGHVPLTLQDGGTIEQLMSKALVRATQGAEDVSAMPFWRVQLGRPMQGALPVTDRQRS